LTHVSRRPQAASGSFSSEMDPAQKIAPQTVYHICASDSRGILKNTLPIPSGLWYDNKRPFQAITLSRKKTAISGYYP
jgi:hypothetical protein